MDTLGWQLSFSLNPSIRDFMILKDELWVHRQTYLLFNSHQGLRISRLVLSKLEYSYTSILRTPTSVIKGTEIWWHVAGCESEDETKKIPDLDCQTWELDSIQALLGLRAWKNLSFVIPLVSLKFRIISRNLCSFICFVYLHSCLLRVSLHIFTTNLYGLFGISRANYQDQSASADVNMSTSSFIPWPFFLMQCRRNRSRTVSSPIARFSHIISCSR